MIPEKIRVKVCKNCPKLGNHYHWKGEIAMVEKGKGSVEILTFNPLKNLNRPNK